jgi:cytochrome c oxidase subunit 3
VSREATGAVGMSIFLGALAMLFAALLLAYAIVRAQAPAWPPAGTAPLPRGQLGANTLLLVGSSVALRAALRGRRHARRLSFGAALALGAAFLAAQAIVWRGLVSAGLGPASGIYGSVFFALSGFHALHVLGGLVALGVVVLRRGSLRLAALYWDFVLAVWLVLYLCVCLA